MKKIILISLYTILTQCSLYPQWTQQTLSTTAQIYDIAFLNKDTGFVAVNANIFLRTTNGGNNWDSITNYRIFTMQAIDNTTLYARQVNGSGFYRTFDGGTTWEYVPGLQYCQLSFVNRDTGWFSGLSGIYKTTNGGLSAVLISSDVSCGYYLNFLKQKYNNEYYGFHISSGFLHKTTNSGVNWVYNPTPIPGGTFNSIFFLNKDTGWCYLVFGTGPSRFMFTSDGGMNWITQYIDDDSNPALEIYFDNSRKGWGGRAFWKIWATSNGGMTWGTQSNPLFDAGQLSFVDSLSGWAGFVGIIHTANSGGVITYIGIDSTNTKIPTTFILKHNYPNPFNPQTTIEFSISKNSYVNLTIYDITGKEILKLYDNENLVIGNYKAVIDFSKMNLSSGVYFYTLKVIDERNKQVFNETKKMVFAK